MSAGAGGGGLLVTLDVRDGTASLTLNRPDKLNALNREMFGLLRAHLEAIAADDAIGCVVLSGARGTFSAGHDLASVAAYDDSLEDHYDAETIDFLEALPKPTIAKIAGHCYAGGLELALGCDILVAGESAQLADTHGRWGVVPAWGMSVRLPERVGLSKAKELMFTGRRLSGLAAAACGLVDHCVPDEELDGAVTGLVAEILANSPGTNRIDKKLLMAGPTMSRSSALAFERRLPFGVPPDFAERMERGVGSSARAKP